MRVGDRAAAALIARMAAAYLAPGLRSEAQLLDLWKGYMKTSEDGAGHLGLTINWDTRYRVTLFEHAVRQWYPCARTIFNDERIKTRRANSAQEWCPVLNAVGLDPG